MIDAKNWPKTMEILEEYLRRHIGVKGVPLYYVVRSTEAVAPSLDEHETSILSAKYYMVVCAPILEVSLRTITFKTDSMKVWGMISVITIYLDCWTYAKSDQRTMYGRKAYMTCGTISWDQIMWITL